MTMIIEIVGIAGSGKSTLAKNIKKKYPHWNIQFRLPRLSIFPNLMVALLHHMVPLYFYSRKGYYLSNLKLILHIETMSKYLVAYNEVENQVLVFDQGIIFEYASLCNIGLKNASQEYLERIHKKLISTYFNTLDMVIYLNADESILLDRVMKRGSQHRLKSMAEEDVREFFTGYAEALSRLEKGLNNKNIPIITIDTGTLNPKQVFNCFEQGMNKLDNETLT